MTSGRPPLPPDELAARATRLRLVLTDADGVLTDGSVWYSERGEEQKRYSLRDGMGFERLRDAGMEVSIVTREAGGPIAARARKLGARAHLGVRDKRAALDAILADAGLSLGEVAYIGDDVNDVGIMTAIAEEGLTGAPADAVPEVQRVAQYFCAAAGGHGAFREFAEWILRLRAPTTPRPPEATLR